jgi:hypothetical protein
MSVARDPDQIFQAWLEEGPTVVPEQTARGIEVSTRAVSQQGRAIPVPWGAGPGSVPSIPRAMTVAVAIGAAVIVIAAGSMLLRSASDQDSVGASPITVGPYTSPQFGYTMDVPAGWDVRPAIKPWPAGQRIETDPTAVDQFRIPGSPIGAAVRVGAQPVPDGTTPASWLTDWQGIREDIGGHCFGSATPWSPTTVATLPAWRLSWRCDGAIEERAAYDEYVFPAGQMGFVITGTPSMVDRMLQTFSLSSTESSAAPSGTAAPSAIESSPLPSPSMVTFTSAAYGYTIGYPSDWTADRSRDDIGDTFVSPRRDLLRIWARPRPAGTSALDWAETQLPDRATGDPLVHRHCEWHGAPGFMAIEGPSSRHFASDVVAGRPAATRSLCGYVDAVIELPDQLLIVTYRSHRRIVDGDRTTFDTFVATLHFPHT